MPIKQGKTIINPEIRYKKINFIKIKMKLCTTSNLFIENKIK